jgi:integrase
MPRQPKLRKKKVKQSIYWFTKAGGDTYFGTVKEVPYKKAKELFAAHLSRLQTEEADSKRRGFTAGDLMDLFLDWVKKHRSDRTYDTRTTYCSRFGAFQVGSRKIRVRDLPADKVKGEDLEAWLAKLKEEGLGAQTRRHADVSVRHAWNWATKHPSPTPYLPPTFRPFSAVELTRVPPKALTEAALMTDQEIQALLRAAAIEPNQFRRHGLKKTVKRVGVAGLRRTDGQVGCFADLLRCYYATGARTDELASCRVEDVLPRTRQVVLGKHKRSETQREKTYRQVTLNTTALEVFARHCQGKQPTDHVFTNDDGRPWTVRSLAKRFTRVKEITEVLKFGIVREDASIYDFRHLWISEMMAVESNTAKVAKMAGTSVAMIERVYGHFRNQDYHDAQDRLDEARKKRGR